jgi:hypothetical protein
MEQPKRDAPSSHHHLARAVSTAARFNDALTEPATQRKSACFTCSAEPFRESVARIARTTRWESCRIPVLDAGLARLRSGSDERTTFGRHFAAYVERPSIRILFKRSRIGDSAKATRCDRYSGMDGEQSIRPIGRWPRAFPRMLDVSSEDRAGPRPIAAPLRRSGGRA